MAGTPQDCISLVIVSPLCLYKTSGHRHCSEVCLEDAAKVDAAPSAAKRGTHPSKNQGHPGKQFGPSPSARLMDTILGIHQSVLASGLSPKSSYKMLKLCSV